MNPSRTPLPTDVAVHPRITLARAEGFHVWDTDRRRYLDATSGAFCVQLGYTRPDLVQAMAAAAAKLPYARPSRFDSEESAAYQRELLAAVGAPFTRVILTSSGSEAVDVAIKIAYRYQVASGHPERTTIGHEPGHYHGVTLGALGVTGVAARRGPYEPLLGHEPASAPAAWILETIPTVGLGAAVPPPGVLATLRARCDRESALWIADEVLTGFGRVGSIFAWKRLSPEHAPDLVVFGKGAGAGFAPVAGVLITDRVARVLDADGFTHVQSYAGNPIACAVGRRVLQAFAEERIYERVRATEPALERALRTLLTLPAVLEVHGLGYLWGIELVGDQSSGAPRDRSTAARVEDSCRDRGVLVHGASAEGGDFILVAPPLTAGEREFEEIVAALAETIPAAAEGGSQ